MLLTATVVAGGVMARLDTLGTERTLDELVLKRTITSAPGRSGSARWCRTPRT